MRRGLVPEDLFPVVVCLAESCRLLVDDAEAALVPLERAHKALEQHVRAARHARAMGGRPLRPVPTSEN